MTPPLVCSRASGPRTRVLTARRCVPVAGRTGRQPDPSAEIVKRGQVSVGELDLESGHVLLQEGNRAGPGDQQHSLVAGQQPGQRNLRRRGVMVVGDFRNRPLGAKAGRATEGGAEWSPGHEGNLVPASKGDQIVVVALEDVVGVLD